MNKTNFRRSGDVNLHPINKLPKGLKKVKVTGNEWILARGEVTNSKHTITLDRADVFQQNLEVMQDEQGRYYFAIKLPMNLTHTADHETTTILPGFYVQTPEREMDHFADVVRKVQD